MFKKIQTTNAPLPVGPYTQGLVYKDLLFISGQTPVNPVTNKLVEGGIDVQTNQIFNNIVAILTEAGASLHDVIKCTIFLTNMKEFAEVNKVYASWFKDHTPARSTVEVRALPLGAIIEIEAIAVVSGH